MSLTSYRTAPPRVTGYSIGNSRSAIAWRNRRRGSCSALGRPGDDLLSHVLRQSTIGAKAFDGRVRDGIGSYHLARATRPANNGFGRRRTENRGRKEVSAVRHLTSVVRLKQNWLSDDGGQRVGKQIGDPSSVLRRLFSELAPWRREQSS